MGIHGYTNIPEVDIGDSLIRFMHHSDTDVTISLVFPVQSVPHHIVTRLLV